MPVSLCLLEHTSSWASGASCSQALDGEDGLLKAQENSAWVPPYNRERAKLQKHHQWCGHHHVRCFSTSTHWCRREEDSRSIIHTGWVEESYSSRSDTKMLSLSDSGAEGNPSALAHATRRQKYQSSRARYEGQRYLDEILGQVAAVQS